MTDATPAAGRPFTGRHMWMLAIAFFGVIFGVNIWLAVASATSWTGMVVEDSYLAGQDYEANRIAHEAQQAAGWRPDFTYAGGVATLSVVDGTGSSIDLGEVMLTINRPVGGHDDQTIALERQPDGTYRAPVSLGNGVWEANIAAPKTQKGPFELAERFRVDGAGK